MKLSKMMENKRSPCAVDQGSFPSIVSKRHKADLSISAKERKEKLGERIIALQQLVSPYGKVNNEINRFSKVEYSHEYDANCVRRRLKTDTASVLWEAMEYIQFLHEQVKVLSAPYLQSMPAAKLQELEQFSLRSRGLCLLPSSCTARVGQSNGADIWALTKTTSPKLEKFTSRNVSRD